MFLKVNHNNKIKKLRFSTELKDFKNFTKTIQEITGVESSELVVSFVDNEKEALPINDKLDFEYFLADAGDNKFKEVFVSNKLNEDKIIFVSQQETLVDSFKKLESDLSNLSWNNRSTPVTDWEANREVFVYKVPELPSQKQSLAYYQGIEEFTSKNPLSHAVDIELEKASSALLKPILLKPIELDSDDEVPIRPINMNLREKGKKAFYKGLEDFMCVEHEEKACEKQKDHQSETTNKVTIHTHVICDICQVHNIQGKRFKCLICPNFDICETCEGKNEHDFHPMIKCSQVENDQILRRIVRKFGRLKKRHEKKVKTHEKLRKLKDLVNPRNLQSLIRRTVEPNIRRAVESFHQRTSCLDEVKQEASVMLFDESSLMREERERLEKEKKEMLKFIFGETQLEIIDELVKRFDQFNMEEMLNEVMRYNNIIDHA